MIVNDLRKDRVKICQLVPGQFFLYKKDLCVCVTTVVDGKDFTYEMINLKKKEVMDISGEEWCFPVTVEINILS